MAASRRRRRRPTPVQRLHAQAQGKQQPRRHQLLELLEFLAASSRQPALSPARTVADTDSPVHSYFVTDDRRARPTPVCLVASHRQPPAPLRRRSLRDRPSEGATGPPSCLRGARMRRRALVCLWFILLLLPLPLLGLTPARAIAAREPDMRIAACAATVRAVMPVARGARSLAAASVRAPHQAEKTKNAEAPRTTPIRPPITFRTSRALKPGPTTHRRCDTSRQAACPSSSPQGMPHTPRTSYNPPITTGNTDTPMSHHTCRPNGGYNATTT